MSWFGFPRSWFWDKGSSLTNEFGRSSLEILGKWRHKSGKRMKTIKNIPCAGYLWGYLELSPSRELQKTMRTCLNYPTWWPRKQWYLPFNSLFVIVWGFRETLTLWTSCWPQPKTEGVPTARWKSLSESCRCLHAVSDLRHTEKISMGAVTVSCRWCLFKTLHLKEYILL